MASDLLFNNAKAAIPFCITLVCPDEPTFHTNQEVVFGTTRIANIVRQ